MPAPCPTHAPLRPRSTPMAAYGLGLSICAWLSACGPHPTKDLGSSTGSTTIGNSGSQGDLETTESGEGAHDDGVDIDSSGPFSDIYVGYDPRLRTVPVVTWRNLKATTNNWVEFRFEASEAQRTPARARDSGEHREALLGIPEGINFEFRLVAEIDGSPTASAWTPLTNGTAPNRVPRPMVTVDRPEIQTHHRWMLGAVSEKGRGGYGGPHWIYIVDRRGRIVWYFQPAGGERGELNQSFWPRIARDGTHITIDQQLRGDKGELLFTTLDLSYTEQRQVPKQGDCYDITDDGHILFETRKSLMELAPDGELRTVWSCDDERCYSNTVNWDRTTDTVMLSFPRANTVVQIDRRTGQLLRSFGDDGDFAFEPETHGLEFNHWAHLTPEGTFMVSSHLPGTQTHLFIEYEIDDKQKTLRRIWSYGEGKHDWPAERGMVERIPGEARSVLGNYGPIGVIVEVTEGGEEAWRVEFGDHLLSHNLLVDDLYALNRGPTP